MMFSVKDFFSKCDQIRIFLRVWSHLLKKSLMENFIFCAVLILMEYFNMTTSNSISSQFLDTFVFSPVNVNSTCFKNSKNPSCVDLLQTNFEPVLWKQTFLKLVSLTIIKWSLMSWNIILQGKVLKQVTTGVNVNLIPITLVLNSLANWIQSFVLSKTRKTVKSYMNQSVSKSFPKSV